MEKRFVYADNSATTRVSEAALAAAMPYFRERYGNASSIYALGMSAARDLVKARQQVADALGAKPNEIYFTSGGSESDNWAIKGAAEVGAAKGKKHIITSVFEHHAVLHTCQYLEKHGFEVTYLPVSPMGLIDPEDVRKAIRDDTCLVTIMFANNEIGTVQPIEKIGEICHEKHVLFHTDAVQAVGNVPIDVVKMHIDLLSLSGHKIHAPKGVGAMYMRSGVNLPNLIHGGAQERTKRAGTENMPSIMALGVAITDICKNIPERAAKVEKMRDRLITELLKIKESRLNGDPKQRLCGNVNISFRGVEGESLLLSLDLLGICASSGSACTSGSLDPSHVLLAIGLPHEIAHGSLRLTINEETTDEDIDYIIEKVPEVVKKLRDMSPLWERICRDEGIEP
ncbi:MAG TPA: cysteine desulfurase NifS [Candidatus Faeciplasma gallinarum]|uniref:Cysteine desulfurase IscS n=1 Tax=Candidatus Faeciplasma gallinarum TaxID=2840799 RepID=A0A9D1ENT7_9FIRM|nr:cysteine desulfurase NifS [Candidatus Faeciplasma gallinarum]